MIPGVWFLVIETCQEQTESFKSFIAMSVQAFVLPLFSTSFQYIVDLFLTYMFFSRFLVDTKH